MHFYFLLSWALHPISALAGAPPVIVCTGLAGCGSDPANVLFDKTLPLLIEVLANIAGGLAVIFIGVAGFQMVLANGDDGKISTARWGVLYALLGLCLAIASTAIVSFVSTEDYGQSNPGDLLLGGVLPAAMRILITIFNVVFVIAIMFAGYRITLGGGKAEELTKGLAVIRWAIAGAVIINVAHAAVKAVLAIGL
ncbi:MAG TPA: hypothetical protein VI873_01455 [Candidatus Peribacteraceae bacterium]|nr:hypothetical protein [Candidatus Peribacteraceae bacterium]